MGTKEELNMEVVRKAIEAFNNQNLEEYFSYHTEDATSHEVYYPEPLNLRDLAEFVPQLWHSYPDWHIDTKAIIAVGDKVAVENVMTATFERDFGDQKATGKSFVVREGVFFDMKDGKIHHVRIYLDQKTQEEQLGIASMT